MTRGDVVFAAVIVIALAWIAWQVFGVGWGDDPPPTDSPAKPEGLNRAPRSTTLAWRHQSELPSIRFRLDIAGDGIMVTVEDQRDPRDWSSFAIADGGVFVMNVTPDDLA